MRCKPIEWIGEATGHLRLLDQTRLPTETEFVDCRTVDEVVHAIRTLQVRGAPAIGVSAAYGVVLGLAASGDVPQDEFQSALDRSVTQLAASRPTAVNLFWALERMQARSHGLDWSSAGDAVQKLFEEAQAIEEEDRAMCTAIGQHGAALLEGSSGVLTHCNAGALATAGQGTALSVIFEAARRFPGLEVFADETRPLWQGARLTAWELVQAGVPCTVICDSMAGWIMQRGSIQSVVVGADRIAANGDVANKIGTYSVAVLAQAHSIPFYVAAPSSTFDFSLEHGGLIPIEERAAEEITHPAGRQIAPDNARVFNPAFDVTPARLVTAIITERGVISPVTEQQIQNVLFPASDTE